MMVPTIVDTVEELSYTTFQPSERAQPVHSLRVDLASGETLNVPNGGWEPENPALAVMAFLSAPPSRLDEAKGATLPISVSPDGEPYIPDAVIERGQQALDDADWFEPAATPAEMESVALPRGSGGGGGPSPSA